MVESANGEQNVAPGPVKFLSKAETATTFEAFRHCSQKTRGSGIDRVVCCSPPPRADLDDVWPELTVALAELRQPIKALLRLATCWG